MRLKTKLP